MHNVTLISTEHRENGKCNPDELHKILESINPNVIFEEEANDDTYKKYDIYKQIIKEHCTMRDKYGFAYLNSEKCTELFLKMKITEKQLIEFIGFGKNELLRIYNLFHKEHDNRENAMLLKIYNERFFP